MTILTIFQLALSFLNRLMGFMNDGQLLEAGKQIRDAENLKRAKARVEQADAAAAHIRELINAAPDGLPPDDGFTVHTK